MDHKNAENGRAHGILVALRMVSITLVIAGVLYPYAIQGIHEAKRSRQAEGLVTAKGKILDSQWIAESFSRPEYFHPLPPAAGSQPADAPASGGSSPDPFVSPETARQQAPRVAAERGMATARLDSLITAHTEGRAFGMFGEPRVSVVILNQALDEMTAAR